MKFVVDTAYIAAMNTPGGGKNDIPNRLKRQFAIFNVPLPSVAAINGIFGKLVEGRFSPDVFSEEVRRVLCQLSPGCTRCSQLLLGCTHTRNYSRMSCA